MSQTRIVASIFVVALLLRLSAFAILPPPLLDTSAEVAYWGAAHTLTQGKGFSDPSYPVYAPPLYALFIATCLKLFGESQISVIVPQIIFDSLTSVVIYIGMSKIFDLRTGILSALLWAIYPFSIYLSISIASEPLFTFLLSSFILLATHALQSQNNYHYCFAGILLALATLTRGVTQFVPIVFFSWVCLFKTTTRQIVVAVVLFCLSFVLILSPWALRNYIVLDDFIPAGTAGGVVFLQGSTEIFFSSSALQDWPQYYSKLLSRSEAAPPKGAKPSQIDKFNAKAGMENYKSRMLNDPLSIAPFLLKKFLRLWYAGESGRNDRIILVINSPIYVLALAGSVLALQRKVILASVPFGIVLYFILVHWASLPLFRYMMPVMPYLFGLAAFTLVAVFDKLGLVDSRSAFQSAGMKGMS